MTVKADIIAHALQAHPCECVGFVSKGKYHKLENIANNPTERYQLTNKDKLMLYRLGDNLQALVHSHPVMDNNPSEMDLGAQAASGFTFWIIGTDGKQVTDIKEIANENANN